MALELETQTYQILTNNDEVCIPSLSSTLLAVQIYENKNGLLQKDFQPNVYTAAVQLQCFDT